MNERKGSGYQTIIACENDIFKRFGIDVSKSDTDRVEPDDVTIIVGALDHEFAVILLAAHAEVFDVNFRRLNDWIFYIKNEITRWSVQLVRQLRLHDDNASSILSSSILTHCCLITTIELCLILMIMLLVWLWRLL